MTNLCGDDWRRRKSREEGGGRREEEEEEEAEEEEAEWATKGASATLSAKRRERLERARAAQYAELAQREARAAKMGEALQRIGMEKALMGKGPRKKMRSKEDGAPRLFKWRQRRKK